MLHEDKDEKKESKGLSDWVEPLASSHELIAHGWTVFPEPCRITALR